MELNFKHNSILLKLMERIDTKPPENPAKFVVDLLKKKDRVQKLSKSSITLFELKQMNYLDSDVDFLIEREYLTEISNDRYVLTIKGMLLAASLLNPNDNHSEEVLYGAFLKKLFDYEFMLLNKTDKPLSSYEQAWLLSMIFLNCFDDSRSIDVQFDEENKKRFVLLFNIIGSFLKENKYVSDFNALDDDVNKDVLRREIETIEKKIDHLIFGKRRACFFVKLNDGNEKKKDLEGLFKRIFKKVDDAPLTIQDLEKIRNFMRECEPFFFKIKRKNVSDLYPDSIVDETLQFLV